MKAFVKNNAVAICLAICAFFGSFFASKEAIAQRISVLETKVQDIEDLNNKVDRLNENMSAICQVTGARCK